ncbi:MAG: MBL fold metallo-hydrolase [Bdellovibrionota bacterium]
MLPASLAQNVATGVHPGVPIAQFEIGSMRNFVYLIIDWSAHQAALVDPQRDLSPIDEALKKHGLSLNSVLLTHTHHDHVAGVPELARRNPALPIYLHRDDRHRLEGVSGTFQETRDGETIPLGSLRIEVLHTPGHSAGECSYLVAGYLLTGDTIFIRDCGRTDFPDGSNEQMFESRQRVAKLPGETILLPGHH